MPILGCMNSSPPDCIRFKEFSTEVVSEPSRSRNPSKRIGTKKTPTSAPTHCFLPEPKSNERKKTWAALDSNLLSTAKYAPQSAMLRACLDALGDASDAEE